MVLQNAINDGSTVILSRYIYKNSVIFCDLICELKLSTLLTWNYDARLIIG